jgi:hypothetical protein
MQHSGLLDPFIIYKEKALSFNVVKCVMLSVANKPIMLSVVMLIVVMLIVVMLIVIMLGVIMLNVMAYFLVLRNGDGAFGNV